MRSSKPEEDESKAWENQPKEGRRLQHRAATSVSAAAATIVGGTSGAGSCGGASSSAGGTW